MKKLFYFCAIMHFFTLNVIGTDLQPEQQPNPLRKLLTIVRGGDFAHPGETEAIDLMITKVLELNPGIINARTLSLGCGFCGTEDYIKRAFSFQHIEGLDIDTAALTYAREKYSDIPTKHGDINCFQSLYEEKSFSFVYMFSSLYAIENHAAVLEQIHSILTDGGMLMLFDYSASNNTDQIGTKDFSGKPMHPILTDSIDDVLTINGFEVIERIDLSQEFHDWYDGFLTKLEEREQDLLSQFTQTQVDQVRNTYSYFVQKICEHTLGGVGIIVKKRR